jgi:hypothetical protein
MKILCLSVLAAVFLAGGIRAANSDCFGDVIRITALVNSGNKVKAGVVELATSNSYFVAAGQQAAGIEIVSINYEKDIVTLRRGDKICVLALSADPNAPKNVEEVHSPDSPLYRGEAIEKFLRENPKAVQEGTIKFPTPPPAVPATGHGETIDRFLSQNPEAARIANTPAVGKGEGIEKYLREHPDIKIDDTPIPEGSMGPGIEAALKNNPIIITNGIPNFVPPPPLAK